MFWKKIKTKEKEKDDLAYLIEIYCTSFDFWYNGPHRINSY